MDGNNRSYIVNTIAFSCTCDANSQGVSSHGMAIEIDLEALEISHTITGETTATFIIKYQRSK